MAQQDRFFGGKNRFHPFLTREAQGEWKSDFYFVQMADTQFGLMGAVKQSQMTDLQPELSSEEVYELELEMTRTAVKTINSLSPPPSFVVVCGDLVNAFPSTPQEQDKQIQDFKELMGAVNVDIPLVCVCGNHDIGDTPNRKTVDRFKEKFGDDFFSFWVQGVKFLVINSQFYYDSSDAKELLEEQDEWLTKELIATKQQEPTHAVVFSHIAPFLRAEFEETGYFNLKQQVRKSLLDRMKSAKVSKWFCGHFHRNAGGFTEDGLLECVVTTAVGTTITNNEGGDFLGLSGMAGAHVVASDSGFRIVKIQKEKITHKFFTIKDMQEGKDILAD